MGGGTRRVRLHDDPEVHAAALAAQWAQRIGLPPGNLWEPAIVRHLVREWRQLGGTPQAWGLTAALFARRLGLNLE